MSKLYVLTKVFLKSGTNSFSTGKKKVFPQALTIILLLILMIATLGIPFGIFIGEIYDLLAPIQQSGVVLSFGIAVVSTVIFMFGIFYVLSTFYFAKDIDYLLPLPVKPSEILGAKFITVVLYEYLTELVLLAPVLIIYGIKSGAGVVYYIYSVVIFFTLPIIPLIMAALINMIIMRFTNLGRRKDAFKVIGGLAALGIGIGINLYIQKMSGSVNDEQLIKLFTAGNNSLVGLASRIFPTAEIAALSLINSSAINGLVNLLLFLAVSGVLTVIFLQLGNKLYFKGVVGVSESYSKGRKLGNKEIEKATKQNSGLKSYIIKEMKILFRTPVYFINCVVINLLWPIFFFIPAISQPEMINDLRATINNLENGNFAALAITIGLAIGLLMSGTNGITSTAISREGQNLFVSKYIPISYKHQILAKVLSGVILNILSISIISVFIIFLLQPPIYLVVLAYIAASLGVIFTAFTGILIDIKSPKLNWDNEQKAVKQNFNLIFNMFFSIIVAVGATVLTNKLQLGLWMTFALIAVVFTAADLVLYYISSTTGARLYEKITT